MHTLQIPVYNSIKCWFLAHKMVDVTRQWPGKWEMTALNFTPNSKGFAIKTTYDNNKKRRNCMTPQKCWNIDVWSVCLQFASFDSSLSHVRLGHFLQEIFRQTSDRVHLGLTCIESALMISPLNFLAMSIASLDLPVPVAPKITTTGARAMAFILAAIFTSNDHRDTYRAEVAGTHFAELDHG